ncbi:hypothetical protein F1728_23510 [Gimesia benthica]|uniref:Uncharacterized protein n=1 Tax=Gimesia benthica TaxID=2608982 RepID=A0A6I6AGQ5_9PLAN|nr:hypothetical protein [Gimesia benthica]QGQ25468.1 hypothetical protein F1728_23510 [Gimesia benthica]
MASACQILLIWITTVMLCAQALGASFLFGCCCLQSRCDRQAVEMDHISDAVEMSCCHQQTQADREAAEEESCESTCGQLHARCQCVQKSTEPALPEQTTLQQTFISLVNVLASPPVTGLFSDASVVRPARHERQDHGSPSHFAQLLFCVSLT